MVTAAKTTEVCEVWVGARVGAESASASAPAIPTTPRTDGFEWRGADGVGPHRVVPIVAGFL